MSLTAGEKLGTFEITGPLGIGGMGEVYRATDTKLGREVAIKTLPAALAEDKDRLARFEREAKLLATLNHAHIASVYNLDAHDGTLYIAMELVEGETLEATLKRGALPVKDALQIGLQIALALEAAHDKGVVHRDLKPANIMITPDGVVKVLDFGLAKAFSGDPNEATAANSPALSLAMTQQGLILGTAGYMSPEQASGQAADQRADIWAFGVVLYEMLTGMPVFSGESVPHVLADVLKTEPDWERLPKQLQWRVRQLLERCLTKKPRNRLHSIADARIEIETALNEPDQLPPGVIAHTAAAHSRRAVLGVGAGAIVTGFALRHLANPFFGQASEPGPVTRSFHPLPTATAGRILFGAPPVAVSPDGRTIAYGSVTGVFRKPMNQLQAQLIAGTERNAEEVTAELAMDLFFSPDGEWVAVYLESANSGRLIKVPIDGGFAQRITDIWRTSSDSNRIVISRFERRYLGGSWGRDRTILYATDDGIFRVSENGGTPTPVVAAQAGELYRRPQLLPDGDSILVSFTVDGSANTPVDEITDVIVVSPTTNERTTLLSNAGEAEFVAPEHIVYAQGADLFGVAFDTESLTAGSNRVPLEQNIARGTLMRRDLDPRFGVASHGRTLAFVEEAPSAEETPEATLVWIDQDGNPDPIEETAGRPWRTVAISPDGRRLALAEGVANFLVPRADQWSALFVTDIERPALASLHTAAEPILNVQWIDNDTVVFNLGSPGELARLRVDGTGSVEILPIPNGDAVIVHGRTPDGSGMVVSYVPRGTLGTSEESPRIGILPLEADTNGEYPIELLIERNDGGVINGQIAPQSDYIVYEPYGVELRESIVYIEQYPERGGRQTIGSAGARAPFWSEDGNAVFYRSTGDALMKVAIEQRTPTLVLGEPEVVYTGPRGFLFAAAASGLGPDGRFLLIENTFDRPDDEDDDQRAADDPNEAPGDRIIIVQGFDSILKQNVTH